MGNLKSSPDSNRGWIMVSAVTATIILGAYYFWPTSRVTLDAGGYQMTIVLYRICNQQDSEGLTELDRRLREPGASQNLSHESRQVIASIISSAQKGRWKDAAVACRQAMDDQVQR